MKKKSLFSFFCFLVIALVSCDTKDVHDFKFKYAYQTQEFENEAYYKDSYFTSDSTIYNPSLATCSFALVMSTFATYVNNTDYSYSYRNGESFLKENGFEDIDVNDDFKKKPTADSLGILFGHKKVGEYTLLSIVIRSRNYEMEWASNFTLGDGKETKQHLGFYQASTIYLNSLQTYIEKYKITGDVKLWSVGYSRGGASNNLSIGRIDQKINNKETLFNNQIQLKKEDIYCYCFEPPMGASFNEEISPKSDIYSNIHNIVNHNDPVTKVAMKDLRFTRYGVDYYLPDKIRNVNFSKMISSVISIYNKVENHTVIGDYVLSDFVISKNDDEKTYDVLNSSRNRVHYTSGLFLDEFLDDLTILGVKDLDNYVKNIQTGLRNVFEIVYRTGKPKFSFMTLGVSFARYILNSSNIDIIINNLLHDIPSFIDDFLVLLNSVLHSLGLEISPQVLSDCVLSLLKIVATVLASDFQYFFTFANTTNMKAVASAHFPELCLAHLMSQDPNYTSDIQEYNSDGSYYYFSLPNVTEDTKLEILDSKNKSVLTLKNGIIDAASFTVCGSKDKMLYCYLPVEQTYQVKINDAYSYQLSYFDQKEENMILLKNETIQGKSIQFETEAYIEKKGK